MHETVWRPEVNFDEGLRATVEWYCSNPEWIRRVKSQEYLTYYERNYASGGSA